MARTRRPHSKLKVRSESADPSRGPIGHGPRHRGQGSRESSREMPCDAGEARPERKPSTCCSSPHEGVEPEQQDPSVAFHRTALMSARTTSGRGFVPGGAVGHSRTSRRDAGSASACGEDPVWPPRPARRRRVLRAPRLHVRSRQQGVALRPAPRPVISPKSLWRQDLGGL